MAEASVEAAFGTSSPLHLEKRYNVDNQIRAVSLVSDGIFVEFERGIHCYFSADFLLGNLVTGSNQVFLPYDPSAKREYDEVDVLSTASSDQSSARDLLATP